jgi:hypothetical protein
MNKKGSHVGAMLSFVIFITFLIFLYSILQPALKTEADKQDTVDYLTSKLRENFSSGLLSVTINITYWSNGPGKSCVSVQNILTGIEEQGLNKDLLIIKNSTNSILPYFIESNGNDLSIRTGEQFDSFFKIYSSNDINSSKCTTAKTSCVGTCYSSNSGYEIRSVGQINETFLKKVRTFKTNYESSTGAYDSIKTQLKVPSNMEFSFIFKTEEGGNINTSTKIPPTTANVYVGETPVLYVDENANLKSGFLTVKVW